MNTESKTHLQSAARNIVGLAFDLLKGLAFLAALIVPAVAFKTNPTEAWLVFKSIATFSVGGIWLWIPVAAGILAFVTRDK